MHTYLKYKFTRLVLINFGLKTGTNSYNENKIRTTNFLLSRL